MLAICGVLVCKHARSAQFGGMRFSSGLAQRDCKFFAGPGWRNSGADAFLTPGSGRSVVAESVDVRRHGFHGAAVGLRAF
jgi:hypothetical protein